MLISITPLCRLRHYAWLAFAIADAMPLFSPLMLCCHAIRYAIFISLADAAAATLPPLMLFRHYFTPRLRFH
jgi:hypothetical protein